MTKIEGRTLNNERVPEKISLCPYCNSMTKTIVHKNYALQGYDLWRCGKCGECYLGQQWARLCCTVNLKEAKE